MKFTAAAVLALAGASGALPTVVAFVASSAKRGAVVGRDTASRTSSPGLHRPLHAFGLNPSTTGVRGNKSELRMVDDDEDEDDDDTFDDDEGFDDEEEDAENPLGSGVDSVSWLPGVKGAKDIPDPKITRDDSELLPLFPLGGIVYTPNSEHVLNIFEPRYRQMYTDILMNGTKRFVVSMSHPTETGRFAAMGVLFELEDLKEVSEMTGDQIKYICNHKVSGRVKLHRILNPSAWESRDTYLRVEGTIFNDSGKALASEDDDEEDTGNDVYAAVAAAGKPKYTSEERAVRDAFSDLVDMQHTMEEDVRFTRAAVGTVAVKDGPGDDGLWQTIKLWQSFADQRLMARQNELQRDFQDRLQEYLKKEKGVEEDSMPASIGFQDLTPELQEEVRGLQRLMGVELKPLVIESTLTMQKILEASDHLARLSLIRYFIEAETRRLSTKKTLQGMFSGSLGGDSLSAMPAEERMDDSPKEEEKSAKNQDTTSSSLFIDEEDAFQ
jgi:Lon protease-like protein